MNTKTTTGRLTGTMLGAAVLLVFAAAMPAPLYTYVWTAQAGGNGWTYGYRYSQTIPSYNGYTGGWVGYTAAGTVNGGSQNMSGVPGVITGAGAPSPTAPPEQKGH